MTPELQASVVAAEARGPGAVLGGPELIALGVGLYNGGLSEPMQEILAREGWQVHPFADALIFKGRKE